MRKITITLTVLGLLVLIAAPSMQAETVISIATDGQLRAGSAREDRTMVSTTQNASTYLTFDLTDYVDDPASAGSFVLDYQLTASGAAPGTINIDYIGTVADNAITTANLIAWLAATAVKGFTVTDPAAGWHELDVSSIASDTFANDYAVFRITATTSDTWVVGTGTYGGTSGATLTISAPRGTVISLQ